MAGGGTGGHVMPALAVARELRRRGHAAVFVGTRAGLEARLVPREGFPLEFIEIGRLKRVGALEVARTLLELPWRVVQAAGLVRRLRPAAAFSMGGFAAGPVALAACLLRLPLVVMEPNAMPGITNRRLGRCITRALVSFPEAGRYFPEGRWEVTGLPVREEFFAIPPKPREAVLTVLLTGGSQGSRRLNEAARESWPLFAGGPLPVRFIHQTGPAAYPELAAAFAATGLEGELVPFLDDMPGAFARSDLVVCRSGAGAVAELAAAGKPAILVPFPYAADDHQLRNAEAFAAAGAARLVLDREMTGRRLFEEVMSLASEPGRLERMGQAARKLARPGAARRAADILEELGARN
jgi:UDP-N-acetylglucosamine--N-acetylmuramyl-(pentapeptide) pyrophosphoryl-undecaprenol N-acetylglucosamine transferase